MATDPESRDFKFYSHFQTEPGERQSSFEAENWSTYFGPSHSFLTLNSPVDSEISSYEIESNAGSDDYTAELSHRMAQYMLQDDANCSSSSARFQSEIKNKSWGLSGSPISTLWSSLGSSNGSSQGSPEGPSKEPSPPLTPVVLEPGGLDISFNVFSKLDKKKPVCTIGKSIQTNLQDEETGSFTSTKEQARTLKNQKRKQNRQSAAIQAKQAQGSTSSQANSGAKPGTGVFLPRLVNYNRPAPSLQPPQPPKKKGCSTVLIPVRVLQALQLHYDKMDDETRQKIPGFAALRAAAAASERTGTHTVNKSHPRASAVAASQNDMRLPQEWTY